MVYYYILKARPCLNQTILTIKFISQIYRYLVFMARKNSTTRKVLLKISAMKSIVKVEKILKGSLDSITSPSPSVKMQIMGGKVSMRWKGKTLPGVVNKLLKTKRLLTSASNVLPYHLK